MKRTPLTLAGASAAVTGAGSGIGRAIAVHLARAGARVALGDVNLEGAQATAELIGEGAFAQALDITEPSGWQSFLDAAEDRHGPLRVMVNNAGVDWIGPFDEEPDDVTRREIEINLYGTILGCRYALRRMAARGEGHLVNIASGAGRVPLPGSASYSASKYGVVGLTESLRLEYRNRGVSFSVVLPSQVRTPMIDGQGHARTLALITPDDVAAAVLDAMRTGRFEVWVPRAQGVQVWLGMMLPRPVREAILRAVGVSRIAGDVNADARRAYHRRAFGRE
jgi:NAD(P)-dependent dehydrogenase (short-subunit alcohol dehydrogenase family)